MNVLGTITNDNYIFTIENMGGTLFCHIDIIHWSVGIYKEMLIKLLDVKEAIETPLWCNILKMDTQKIKLALMFGFVREYESEDNYIMRLL